MREAVLTAINLLNHPFFWLVLFVLITKRFLRVYLDEKAKNLATKEDIRKLTQEVEAVKLHYASQLHVAQVRYQREFEILSDLAQKLVELRDAALTLRPIADSFDPSETDEQRKERRLKKWFETARALYQAAEKYRPFYPEEIYRAYQSLDRVVYDEALSYELGRMNVDPGYREKAEVNASKISELANATLSAIRDRVRTWELNDGGPK